MERGVRVVEQAPYFRALTAGSGREVSLRTCAGRRLVLIFHAQNTSWAAERVNRAVRERCPSPEEVVVASVVDLNLVPPLYWLTASVMIGQAHEKSAREELPVADPAEYVLILQDWGGLISRGFGVRGVDRAGDPQASDFAIYRIDRDAATPPGREVAGLVFERSLRIPEP